LKVELKVESLAGERPRESRFVNQKIRVAMFGTGSLGQFVGVFAARPGTPVFNSPSPTPIRLSFLKLFKAITV
jgi:hypothetical protein